MKIFLSLLTFFVFLFTSNSFAQQSCNNLFESTKESRLSLANVNATRDLVEYFSQDKVISRIKNRNPFLQHSPELEVSIHGSMKNLIIKLDEVQKLGELKGHKGLGFLSSQIKDQILFVEEMIQTEKLSYLNYLYNSFVLMSSMDALLRLESSVLTPKIKHFEMTIHRVYEEVIIGASKNLDSLSEKYRFRLKARDVSRVEKHTLSAELGLFKVLVGTPSDLLTIFFETHYLPIISFKPIHKEDFIDIDMERLLLVEASTTATNPHGGYWFALSNANHDIFHINEVLKTNHLLNTSRLSLYWLEARNKIKIHISEQSLGLQGTLNEHLYDSVHNNPHFRVDIANFYKGYSEGNFNKDLFEKIYDMSPGLARLLIDVFHLNPDGSPSSSHP